MVKAENFVKLTETPFSRRGIFTCPCGGRSFLCTRKETNQRNEPKKRARGGGRALARNPPLDSPCYGGAGDMGAGGSHFPRVVHFCSIHCAGARWVFNMGLSLRQNK